MPSFMYNIGVFASVGDSSIMTPFACSKAFFTDNPNPNDE